MIEVIGVSLSEKGKTYHFSPDKLQIKKGMNVIVETEKGMQLGTAETEVYEIEEITLKSPLKKVKRIATSKDEEIHQKNKNDATLALIECKRLVELLGINMQVMDANFTFNRDQLVFRFVSDNRVDFRELAKKLASKYKTRIELRQVGVRDKAREVGGLAPCGKKLCCSQYSYDFNSVSINMAKNQNIALNPNKISGVCGRLLCCLKYEDETYTVNRKKLPYVGKKIKIEKGEGTVVNIDILNLMYKVDIPNLGVIEVKVDDEG